MNKITLLYKFLIFYIIIIISISMDKLPNELIQEILERNDPTEIRGLCNSSSTFREQCNESSKHILKRDYTDFYQLYLSLHQYYICVTSNAGQTRFTNTNGLNNIAKAFKNLMSEFEQRMQRDTNISWTFDNLNNPKMLAINFHYYSDLECVENFDVIIQGDFKNYKTLENIVDETIKTFEEM
jgi:hypothetical protein